jgi:hypothetical protein
LYSVDHRDPNHDALIRIGERGSEAAGPFYITAQRPRSRSDHRCLGTLSTANKHLAVEFRNSHCSVVSCSGRAK